MRKRSTYRPRIMAQNPVAFAIEGALPITGSRLAAVQMLELQALEAFAKGNATPDDWRSIADVVNLSETLCEMGIGRDEVTPIRIEVEEALGDAHARFERTHRVGTTGQGLRAMRALIEYHDLQRQSIALSVYEQAIVKTQNRIRGASPKVKVYITEKESA